MDRALLNKATSPDFEPVPGYVFLEVVKMSQQGPAVCKQLEEYLISKLQKDHAGVKLKALKIIRHTCEQGGSIDFRRMIQRRSDVIKQNLSYRGQPDPLRGDAPNKAVRDEAQEALKALFAAENGFSSTQGSSALQGRIQGIGSSGSDFGGGAPVGGYAPQQSQSNFSNSSYGQSSSMGGGRPMQGFGNPYFPNDAAASQSGFSLGKLNPSTIMASDNPGQAILSAVQSGLSSVVQSVAQKTSTAFPGVIPPHYLPSASGPPPTMPTRSGPGDWQPPRINPNDIPSSTAYSSGASQDVQYGLGGASGSSPDSGIPEQRAVNELCTANAARVAPTQQTLDAFVQKAETLNPDKLAFTIVSKLSDNNVPWMQKTKALYGIEALQLNGLDAVGAVIAETGAVSIFNLFTSPQCGAKAKSVASLLALPGAPPPTADSAPRVRQATGGRGGSTAVAAMDDLLDLSPTGKPGNHGTNGDVDILGEQQSQARQGGGGVDDVFGLFGTEDAGPSGTNTVTANAVAADIDELMFGSLPPFTQRQQPSTSVAEGDSSFGFLPLIDEGPAPPVRTQVQSEIDTLFGSGAGSISNLTPQAVPQQQAPQVRTSKFAFVTSG